MQICNNILNVICTKLASSDVHVVQEAQILQKSYYQFLMAVINNDLINVIVYQDAENVYRIFNTAVQGSSLCNSETQKICFQIIGKFIGVFGEFFFNVCLIICFFK